VPLLAGGALELPLGLLACDPRRRRLAVLGGGIVFILSLAAVASARSFAVLLCAFTAFFPASGAFVSLTQAELMDAWPGRQATIMARWDLAGSAGAVAGPLLLTLVLAGGGSWRAAYLVLAAVAAAAWVASVLRDHGPPAPPSPAPGQTPAGQQASPEMAGSQSWTARIRDLAAALRDWPTARWLALLQVADLLVDVLTGFLALPGRSSVAVTLSSAAGLAGGLGPLAVGIIAERAGLPWALGVLAVVPVVIGIFGPGSGGSRATGAPAGPRARTTDRSDK